jgi:hypothetical protein
MAQRRLLLPAQRQLQLLLTFRAATVAVAFAFAFAFDAAFEVAFEVDPR